MMKLRRQYIKDVHKAMSRNSSEENKNRHEGMKNRHEEQA